MPVKTEMASMDPPPPANSGQPGVTRSLLYNGSRFQGHQKSKGQSYDVEVVLQVIMASVWDSRRVIWCLSDPVEWVFEGVEEPSPCCGWSRLRGFLDVALIHKSIAIFIRFFYRFSQYHGLIFVALEWEYSPCFQFHGIIN